MASEANSQLIRILAIRILGLLLPLVSPDILPVEWNPRTNPPILTSLSMLHSYHTVFVFRIRLSGASLCSAYYVYTRPCSYCVRMHVPLYVRMCVLDVHVCISVLFQYLCSMCDACVCLRVFVCMCVLHLPISV